MLVHLFEPFSAALQKNTEALDLQPELYYWMPVVDPDFFIHSPAKWRAGDGD
jgi:hypothetical protein